ncbi:hypothetical protein [Leisingera sp. M523]|uniref:hypothetical protein n=1 Tax=Leisingera sp. M523 TaxID=2867013 RepID=UPI0021A60F74|nr:hypothetical protein [Leisingera sp. M523]UWQ29934.1 hypothetical protein K3557_05130 [Leisingera sp. M523]
MLFVKSIIKVLSWGGAFCVFCGVAAGLADDVPDLNSDENVIWFLQLMGYLFTSAIYFTMNYPIGVLMFVMFLAGMHCLYTLPAEQQMKTEVAKRRRKNSSPKKNKSRKRKHKKAEAR